MKFKRIKTLIYVAAVFIGGSACADLAGPHRCEMVLARLNDIGKFPEASRGVAVPRRRLPEPVRRLVESEGGLMIYLNKGSFGHVYKWVKRGEPTIVVKHYEVPDHAQLDDARFAILKAFAREGDFVEILDEVRPRTAHLRFYEYIHGLTIAEALGSANTDSMLAHILNRERDSYLENLTVRLEANYGSANVSTTLPELIQIFVKGQSKRMLYLHDENWIFSPRDGRLVIIDPY